MKLNELTENDSTKDVPWDEREFTVVNNDGHYQIKNDEVLQSWDIDQLPLKKKNLKTAKLGDVVEAEEFINDHWLKLKRTK